MTQHNSPRIVPALEFFHANRSLFSSDVAGYGALKGPMKSCVVNIGRKKFVNLDKWAEFVERGGAELPGGWRREVA